MTNQDAVSDLRSERIAGGGGDPDGPPGAWLITFGDGSDLVWEGFYTGPRALSSREIETIGRDLLGLEPDEVPAAAARELRPYVAAEGAAPLPSLVLHSATPVLKFLEAEMGNAMSGRQPDDVATYVESRAVSLARPGDLVVGRTRPWELAARLAGIEAVAIPGIDFYYLSHALLKLMHESRCRAPEVVRLVEALRARPDTLVRLYSLDRETQIALMCLRRLAGIDALLTDANSPEVGDYWNTKAPLYPTVADALEVDPLGLSPAALLAAETALSPMSRRLGLTYGTVPGYTIESGSGLLPAARLLVERYGLRVGCLKPSQGGAGGRIELGVALDDPAELARLAGVVASTGEAYVLEAHVAYVEAPVAGPVRVRAPSGHVRHGHVADGLTLQLVSGTSWQGNVYVDEATCASLGVEPPAYRAMRDAMHAVHAAFGERRLGLVTAGLDFAYGRVGGAFGDDVLIGIQDPNLSSHGAELLRLFRDSSAGRGRYVATKVVVPTPGSTVAKLRSLSLDVARGRTLEMISAVPGRWGMIAAAAESPPAALEEVLARERELAAGGWVKPARGT